MTNDKPAWTTTLQQDLAAVREDLEKITNNSFDLMTTEVRHVIEKIEAMERKLQVARCTAIAALEEL